MPSVSALIARSKPSECIHLHSHEYLESCVVHASLTMQGGSESRPAYIIGTDGPALTITAGEVTLINIVLEAGKDGVALRKHAAAKLMVRNVAVRGRVEGIAGEDGPWDYPPAIDLGCLPSAAPAAFEMQVRTPVACTIATSISTIELLTTSIPAGCSTIAFRVLPCKEGCVLFGYLYIMTAVFRRWIQLTGKFAATPPNSRSTVVWRCQQPEARDAHQCTTARQQPDGAPSDASSDHQQPTDTPPQRRKAVVSLPTANPLFGTSVHQPAASSASVVTPPPLESPPPSTHESPPKPKKSLPNPAIFGIRPPATTDADEQAS